MNCSFVYSRSDLNYRIDLADSDIRTALDCENQANVLNLLVKFDQVRYSVKPYFSAQLPHTLDT